MDKIKIKPLDDFPNYFISSKGKVLKMDKQGKFKEVKDFTDSQGSQRVNMKRVDGKYTTKQLHTLVYKAFRDGQQVERGLYNTIDNSIVFIDGNSKNCSLDNLITVEELKAFYLANRKEV